jgi:hypothetical protein
MERRTETSTPTTEHALVALAYELLDAHDDTARLVHAGVGDEQWPAHLDYLRCLQRRGREVLAAVGSPDE